ncbi:putative 3-phosphoinositide-dependent protein kinase 2 [Sycon ciliatum]|uniref:putative 3-phosphoinositide-dependent protein kinase 2 n=1 Tax=Sycon ciliatum TaxID=27933 RepID=UPI0031F63596|eukprot:scpid80548/ scgid14624/ 3-phosphoinositide-dependent protein kinase 1; Protein kinase B kinase
MASTEVASTGASSNGVASSSTRQQAPGIIAAGPAASSAMAVANAQRKRGPGDFNLTQFLGEGSFSRVRLGIEKATGKEVAVKIVDKQKIIREKKVQFVTGERDILSKLKHPFVVQLHCTFQDEARLYFCLSLAKRGELFAHLQRVGCMDRQSAQFYAAEIVLVLEYLRSQCVVHRDLKPENILLGRDWHILLSDFGTARVLQSDADYDSSPSSFVGTAQYVTPEVLQRRPIAYSSDLWALGCIIFQFLAGTTLFSGQSEYAIFNRIVACDFTFPDDFPKDTEDIVRKLVVKDQKQRLGCREMGDFAALKEHSYFSGFDWENVDQRSPPPMKSSFPTLGLESQTDIWEHFYAASQDWEEDLLDDLKLPSATTCTDAAAAAAATPCNSSGSSTSASVERGRTQAALDEHKRLIKEQKINYPIWHPFCKNEVIQRTAPTRRHKGYKVEERQLILSEKRLFSVELSELAEKGEIKLDAHFRCEYCRDGIVMMHEGTKSFCIEFEDSGTAKEWMDVMDKRAGR